MHITCAYTFGSFVSEQCIDPSLREGQPSMNHPSMCGYYKAYPLLVGIVGISPISAHNLLLLITYKPTIRLEKPPNHLIINDISCRSWRPGPPIVTDPPRNVARMSGTDAATARRATGKRWSRATRWGEGGGVCCGGYFLVNSLLTKVTITNS